MIYVGKAKNLRSRAGSYFLKAAADDRRTADLVREIRDIDFIAADSEVDALLLEARLIKDMQPQVQPGAEGRQDVSLPGDHHARGFSARRVHAQAARRAGTKLYGPFASARKLRGAIAGAAEDLQVPHLLRSTSTRTTRRWRWFRPCLLASINQCTAPCNLRISKEEYRRDIDRLKLFLDGKKRQAARRRCGPRWQAASQELKFEKAARLRDEIKLLETLDQRGDLDDARAAGGVLHRPQEGAGRACRRCFKLPALPRPIEGVDIAHLGGGETVASLVQFIDGLPFKPGYQRFKIRGVEGIDDFASASTRSSRGGFSGCATRAKSFPDILLIDGGKGQLNAALAALSGASTITPPFTISLAKHEEEIYVPGEAEPLRLSRHSYALRLLQYVRDEAHRFAQHYHHLLRKKSTLEELRVEEVEKKGSFGCVALFDPFRLASTLKFDPAFARALQGEIGRLGESVAFSVLRSPRAKVNMAVKVRCPTCERVLNAPDAARGKAVKCPDCETKVKVPSGDSAAAAGSTTRRTGTKAATKKRARSGHDASFWPTST